MSFQRSLTGESSIYANVILNTNVCANSVSTINLSATNASFTNITTNTWTTGNVSTPNVIATNAYFSNLYTSNYNICVVTTSSLYSSNASFTNVSISSHLTVPNISTLQTINGATALRLQTNGGVVVKDRDTSDPALIQLNYASTPSIETYGMYLEANKSGTRAYARIGAGENTSLQFYADTVPQLENTSTTGWTFYNKINSSYATNFSNLSVSTLSASSLGISSLNVCSLYAYAINDVKDITSGMNICIFSNNLVIRDAANASTKVLFNYDDATFTEVTGMAYEIGVSGVNISVQGTLPLTLLSGTTAQMRHTSNIGFSFYKPIYTSQIYTSNMSSRNLWVTQTLQYTSGYGDYSNTCQLYSFYASAQVANISALSGVSAVYTCIYCSNLSVSNLSASSFVVGNLAVDDTLNASKVYASNVYSSNMSVGNRIDANRVVLTLSLDAPISNVSDARVSSIKGVSTSFTSMYASEINTCSLTVPSLTTTNFSVSNLSASYLTGTSTFFVDMYSTNIVTTGIVSTSYFSSKDANISKIVTANICAGNCSLTSVTIGESVYLKAGPDNAYENYATNGTLTGAVFYNAMDTRTARHRFQYLADDLLSINSSQIIAYKHLYSASSIFVSAGNVCNFSVTNLSVSTLTVNSFSLTNTSVDNLSVAVALTAVSAFVSRLTSTSAFVSNLSTSNISCNGRISVSNISATSISATGRINADNIRTTTDVIAVNNVSGLNLYGGTVYTSAVFVSLNVNCSTVSSNQVSSTSMATSWLNASNISVSNASITTITGTTTRFTTGNFSTLAVSNAVVNMCVSTLYASSFTLTTSGTTSTYGTHSYVTGGSANRYSLQSNFPANILSFGNNGNVRFDISVSGVSCYENFYTSDAYISRLYTSTFSPGTVTTQTVNASNGYFSALYASTWVLPTTLNVSQLNASNICTSNALINNVSGVGTIFHVGSTTFTTDALYIRNHYASIGGDPYVQFDYWRASTSALDRGITMYSEEARGSVIDGGLLPLEFRADDITQASVSTTSGWRFYNTINTSYQTNISKLAVSNMSLSGTANISTINSSTLNASNLNIGLITADNGNIINVSSTTVNASTINSSTINNASGTFTTMTNFTMYSSIINVSRINNTSSYVSNSSIDNASITTLTTTTFNSSNTSITNLSVITALTIPNNVCCENTATTLKLHSTTTNTQSTGIRVPNYIDGVDTGTGMFIGYNHTNGFINFNRVIRSFDNITVDGNLNQITTTNNLGIGRNMTTGNLFIGDTAMTGNVCINTSGGIQIGNVSMGGNISFDTAGDVVFNCDRRSTWNTSDLIKNSTQLGSFYRQFASVNQTKTSTGQTFVFSPNNANTSLSTLPVGLYLVSANALIRTNSGYNSNLTGFNLGTVIQSAYNFTTGGTRQFHASLGTLNTSGTTDFVVPLSFTGLVNVTTTGQYVGVFSSITAVQAATTGSIFHEISSVTVVKIA